MKIWTSEHVFNHPWETVTQATWRKYPNPLNSSVVAIDVVERRVKPCGSLYTHRLLTTRWGMPGWAQRILGGDKPCFASEHSTVDPQNRTMTLVSRNLTFCNELEVVEKLTYSPHPSQDGATLLRQEAVVTIRGVPLSSHLESFITNSISANSRKGRQAMEHVIGLINTELDELRHTAARGVEDLTHAARKGVDELQHEFTLRAETLGENAASTSATSAGSYPTSGSASTPVTPSRAPAIVADRGFWSRLSLFNLFASSTSSTTQQQPASS